MKKEEKESYDFDETKSPGDRKCFHRTSRQSESKRESDIRKTKEI